MPFLPPNQQRQSTECIITKRAVTTAEQYVLQERLPLGCHTDQQKNDVGRCRHHQPGTILSTAEQRLLMWPAGYMEPHGVAESVYRHS